MEWVKKKIRKGSEKKSKKKWPTKLKFTTYEGLFCKVHMARHPDSGTQMSVLPLNRC
jgi:hypothetical protein